MLTVNKNVIRMGKLLEDINNVNKIENFNFILNPEEVEISNFFEQKILEYGFLTDEKNIQLHNTFKSKSPNLTTIVIDKERFNQVIDNLFMNSLRFTPENGEIYIKLIIHDTYLEFNIFDTGPGFKLHNIKDIFQKFYQEDQSRSVQKGHYGLGLYIVKKIVEKHKGLVKAMNSNHPDYKGAHIKVKLEYLQSSIRDNEEVRKNPIPS